ncbi:MAG: glycosyltransferase family 2 protein [Desulfurobacteriaceae bacterium]
MKKTVMSKKKIEKFPKVYIIVLNYNGWADTIECLESILRNDYPNYQVIVVDNNSSDNSMEYIKAWAEGKLDVWVKVDHPLRRFSFPPVKKPIPYVCYTRKEAKKGGNSNLENSLKLTVQPVRYLTNYPLVLIQTGENLGYAGGNNIGIRYALAKDDFEYIWILNNDTIVSEDSLSSLVCCINETGAGAVGSTIFFYKSPYEIQTTGVKVKRYFLRDVFSYRMIAEKIVRPRRVDSLVGCSFLIRKKVLKTVGLFDEQYFLYHEEADLFFRASNSFKFFVSPESKVWHKYSATTGGETSNTVVYYGTRNGFLFSKKHNPCWKHFLFIFLFFLRYYPVRVLKLFPKLSKLIIYHKAILDGIRGRYGKAEIS